LKLSGARHFCRKFPTWLGTAHYAAAAAS
jgi:hypothetical protein